MRKPVRSVLIGATAAAAAIAPAAAMGGSAHSSAVKSVTIKNIDFKPATVRIHRGDSVRWVWRDGSIPHDVHSTGSRRFKSSSLKKSGTYRVRFRRNGTYRYVCTIHPNMKGKVVVR